MCYSAPYRNYSRLLRVSKQGHFGCHTCHCLCFLISLSLPLFFILNSCWSVHCLKKNPLIHLAVKFCKSKGTYAFLIIFIFPRWREIRQWRHQSREPCREWGMNFEDVKWTAFKWFLFLLKNTFCMYFWINLTCARLVQMFLTISHITYNSVCKDFMM